MILRQLVAEVHLAKYFSIIVDETSDIAVHEQVSFCICIVTDSFTIKELFLGFYETLNTSSNTLVKIILDVLQRFNLSLAFCRGQCYDGAANMSGAINGVRAKILEMESRAIHIHCLAHSLNLVVQESVQLQEGCRNSLNIARKIIVFVKNSQNRLAFFCHFQKENENEGNLRPFCPTRWTRFVSMNSIVSNYSSLIQFMNETAAVQKNDAGAKVNGFFLNMMSFDFFFHLNVLVKIFSHVDATNTILQKASLSFQKAIAILDSLITTIQNFQQEEYFADFWKTILDKAFPLESDEPQLPRQRRVLHVRFARTTRSPFS